MLYMNLHFLSFDSACEASQVHGIVTGEDEIGCHVQSITNKTLRRRLTTEDSGIPPEDFRRSLVRKNSVVRRRSSIDDSEEISQDDLIRNSLLRKGSRGSSTTGDNGVTRRSPVPSRRKLQQLNHLLSTSHNIVVLQRGDLQYPY